MQVILSQRVQKQNTSTAAARVVLARDFVDFFEKHVPTIATAVVSIFGAAIMLLIIEPWVGLASTAALVAALTLMPRFAHRNQQLHERVNDRLEKEIGLVERVGAGTLLRHYQVLSRLRIWLSDREAIAFLFVGSAAAVLFAFAISQLAFSPEVKAGHIYAVMTYLWTFVSSLDEAPGMIDQMARLKDLGNRVSPGADNHAY